MKRLCSIRGVLAACLLSLALIAPALSQPALWVARQGQSTLYLFGTVHLLSSATAWRYPALEQALRDSDSLFVEQTDDGAKHMQALLQRYGFDPAHPLSSKLTRIENARLAQAAKATNGAVSLPLLQIMRPWLAALTLTMAPLKKAGFKTSFGVDQALRTQMLAAGKPVLALETAEQQIRLLAALPPAAELALLRATLATGKQDTTDLAQLVSAWQNGDVAAIAAWEGAQLGGSNSRLYRRMLVKRNRAWAKKLARQLQQPGTVFVAVGAGHLAGPDSLQVQLKKLGIEAVRQ
ncbi:MAG: TraB/GumN family protein [Rhodanobacter sp.]